MISKWSESSIAKWGFDEGMGSVVKDSVSGKEDRIEFALRTGRYQAPVDPIWHPGIAGHSLWFDGYSTYIRRSSQEIKHPVEGLTITVWIAPSSFEFGEEERLSAIISQHNREAAEGYIFGIYKNGAWSLQLGIDGEWVEIWSYDRPIPLNKWTFLSATYDQASKRLQLYYNGVQVAEKKIDSSSGITPHAGDFIIGRNNQGSVLAGAFTLNHYQGFMDELTVYPTALHSEDIQELYAAYLHMNGDKMPESVTIEGNEIRSLRAKDRHRPQFHLSPPSHWMNEPHAPFYFNGQYHLFYQYNPRGPFWHHIHWGHWISDDLVHWKDLPPALSPGNDFDSDGIWSGSACHDKSGNPVLFYTGGKYSKFPTQTIGLARSCFPIDGDHDLKHWVKHPEPIVEQEKEGGLFGEFRDPFVWEEDGIWYMLVGTGTGENKQGGTATVYTSTGDLTQWELRGPLYVSNYEKYPFLGIMWELPVLLPLPFKKEDQYVNSDKHVLLISPWGEGADIEVYYWIGSWDKNTCQFKADHEEPRLIDVGDFHFTGPSGMVDPRTGRTLLFTIAQGERTPEIDYDSGWAHNAGIPVSLFLRNDDLLGIEPIREMQQLRKKLLLSATDDMDGMNRRLADVKGDQLEIHIHFGKCSAEQYGISVRRTPEGEEETLLYYDARREWLSVNRTRSTLETTERIGGIQGGSLQLDGETLQFIVYVDRSMIECYANGIKSLTTRTYPSRIDALGVAIWSTGPIELMSVEVWEMGSIIG
ncbi:GH32 C-terminal domain-containing protein [Paenibacillus puerhi]|uniref:GH32 C-terminal domain-containing protein n=1 Tax=Paenibacillus puerhi TaxID=2692622 RepID=UPI00135AB0A5|nr:GH32 C-terminal domain-containing protein [Paenibacillus puerhi]